MTIGNIYGHPKGMCPSGSPTCTGCNPNTLTAESEVDLWGDIPMHLDGVIEPEAEEPGPEETVAPEPEIGPEPATDLPEIGSDSGFTYRGRPVEVTRFNRDILHMLDQDALDNNDDSALSAFRRAEEEAINNRVTAADVTLPDNPTPEDVRRVAEAVADAFTRPDGSIDPHNPWLAEPHPCLFDVYGTPDRALVAVGAAVANRADDIAEGHAEGGAEAVEASWLDRKEKANAAHESSGAAFKPAELLNIEYARDPQTRRALDDMSKAYREALGEIRDMGGSFDLHSESSKPGAAVVAATGQVWPADWIEASNSCPNKLHIGRGTRRAHYAHDTEEEFTKRGQGEAIIRDLQAGGRFTEVTYGPGLKHLQRNVGVDDHGKPVSSSRWFEGDRVSTYATYEPLTSSEKAQHGFDDSDNSYRVKEWEWRDVETADKEYDRYLRRNLTYRGVDVADDATIDDLKAQVSWRGIKVQKHPLEGGEIVTDPNFNNGEPFYRKPKVRQNPTGEEKVSQIRLSSDKVSKVPDQDDRYRPAVHEVGHRMEYLVPGLSEMTHSWRGRRVSESPTAEGRVLRPIYRGTREQGYTDEFVEHYMGKSYDDRASSPFYRHPTGVSPQFKGATEIFSMGAESVMAGSNGGLIGLSAKHRPDPDMRHFILGVFATAGLKRSDQ